MGQVSYCTDPWPTWPIHIFDSFDPWWYDQWPADPLSLCNPVACNCGRDTELVIGNVSCSQMILVMVFTRATLC